MKDVHFDANAGEGVIERFFTRDEYCFNKQVPMIINQDRQWNSGRILIADDDLLYRRMLQQYLDKENFSVITAADGHEALSQLTTNRFDLCIFDYCLPDIAFETVIERLNRSVCRTPFIIMTGDESRETEKAARRLGPVFFFIKPFSLSDFGSVVREVIGQYDTSAANRSQWSLYHE